MTASWQIADLGGAPVSDAEKPFVHLHGHSIYSLKDAISNIYELVETAHKRGMNALAITDHGAMYGSFEFYETAKLFNAGQEAKGLPGVTPIIGCEMYECNDRLHPNGKLDPNYHLPVLAITSEGYSNLVQIVSDAATKGLITRPGTGPTEETDLDFIRANGLGKGLVALTGCLGSRIPQLLIGVFNDDGTLKTPPNPAEAEAFLQKLKDTFDHVFIELQFHDLPLQQVANMALIELAAKTQTPMVVTRDYHYINQADGEVHDIYVQCARGMDPYPGGHIYYLTSPQEMYDWLDNHPQLQAHAQKLGIDLYEALRNTQRIANAVDVHIPEAYAHFPAVDTPEGYPPRDYLRKLCFDRLIEWATTREIDVKAYIERLEYELSVIEKMNVVPYFLTLWRIIHWCKHEADPPVPVGPGRGSGAGSLVLSLLEITEGDPIKDGLLFERRLRSLNPVNCWESLRAV